MFRNLHAINPLTQKETRQFVAISQNIIKLLNLYCMGDIVTGQLNIETIKHL